MLQSAPLLVQLLDGTALEPYLKSMSMTMFTYSFLSTFLGVLRGLALPSAIAVFTKYLNTIIESQNGLDRKKP